MTTGEAILEGEPDHSGWAPRAALSFIELFALSGLAVTQPVLDVFGRAPDLFAVRGADRFDIIAFAIIVALLPAVVLWSAEQLVGLAGRRARQVAHLGLVGLLGLLIGLGVLKQAELASGALLVVAAAAFAAVLVLAHRHWAGVRLWLRYLGLAPLFFVGLFLMTSPTADLLSSQDVASAEIGTVTDPRTVVFLVLDEWPLQTIVNGEGQIDPDIYPNLAALAADGTWYRNATTAANFTSYAVPAILTGRDPVADRTAVASEHPENLFTLLSSQFDLDVIESVTRMCPSNLCDDELIDHPGRAASTSTGGSDENAALRELLTDARQTYRAMVSPDPDATSPAQTFTNEAVALSPPADLDPDSAVALADDASTGGPDGLPELSLQSVEDLVASIEAGQAPTLHFLHLMLPHTPYIFLPDGRQYTGGPDPQAEGMAQVDGRGESAAEMAFIEQRLVMQAARTDRVVGRVMDRLEDTGLYDDAIVVVTSDHGIGLTPGGVFRRPTSGELSPENYSDLYYVPLLIKAPGLGPAGTISDDNVSTIDILPTIVAAMGFDLPWAVDGIDLGSEVRPGPDKRVGLVTGGFEQGPLVLSDHITFDGDEQLAEVLDRNIDTRFGADNPAHRLFAIADGAELVGRRVDDLQVTAPADLTAVVDDPDAFGSVDLSSGTLPAHLVADFDDRAPADMTVAVALNGRVAAVSPIWAADLTPHHLEAMLLPRLFRDGENDIELFRVNGPEGRRTLSPITVSR